MKRDIHHCDRRLEYELNCIKSSAKLTEQNKKLIQDFLRDCRIDGAGYGYPLNIGRVVTYACKLRLLGEWLEKDFDKACIDDIKKLLQIIETRYPSPYSKQFMKVTIKKFYKWLKGGEEYPDIVKGIKTNVRNPVHQWNLPTEEEVIKMVNSEPHPRNRAFIMCLAESGARIGEIATLDVENVVFDDLGAKIVVYGKTGQRTIRLLASAPYLAEWLNVHPQKDNPKAPLWVNVGAVNRGEQMEYANFSATLKKIAIKAGVAKRVNPHSFRHLRATILGNWMTQSQRSEYMGWAKNSRMPQVYDHLTAEATEDPLLQMCGIEPKKKKEIILKPKVCKVCQNWNEVTASICKKCARPLDLQIAITMEEKKVKDIEAITGMMTPEVLEGLLKKIIESKFEELVKVHPNATAFLDTIAEKILARS